MAVHVRRWFRAAVVLLVLSCVAALPRVAAAQSDPADSGVTQTPNPVEPDFKGVIGLGLIGTELGFVIPAVSGARDAWYYIVFPIVGAGAGGTAGYFLLEKGAGEPELAVATLTVSMALMIPAMVITLAATAYDPETDEPGSAAMRQLRAAREGGPGLVRLSDGELRLAPPAIAAGTSISAAESLRTGVPRDPELRVAVVSGRF